MQLQSSRLADHDLDRLYDFLITNKASKQTAHNAIATIKKGMLSLKHDPKLGVALDDRSGRDELSIKFGKRAYIVRYFSDYEANVIRILRIWHSREDR